MRFWTAFLLLAGCAGLPPPEEPVYPERYPLSPGELAHLHRAGVSDDVIIENIEREGVVGGLPSEEAERLRSQGVSAAVIEAYRQGRVADPLAPVIPAPRNPRPEYGRINDPYWYWDEPWEYPAQVD